MSLFNHIKYSSIPFLVLLPIAGVKAVYFYIGSIMIDIDHYPLYVFETKSLSIKGMFRHYDGLLEKVKNIPYLALCMFHTIEFLIILVFFSFFSNIIFYALLGILFHLVLDAIDLYKTGCLSKRAISIIEYFIRKKAIMGV